MEWQEASAGRFSGKVLAISLTDNKDPFFLHNVHLSEEEFEELKTTQGLRVDFSSFPQRIIDYINMCLHEERRFVLVFSIKERLGNSGLSQFDIIEINSFKHLTHLSLKFVAATDSEVRLYLTTCFNNLKEENRRLQNNLNYLENELKEKSASYQRTLDNKTQELDLLKKDYEVERTKKENEHASELLEEKKRFLDRLKEEENRFEREIKAIEDNYKRQIERLELKTKTLDAQNKELQNNKRELDSTVKDLSIHVLSLEKDTERLQDSARSYKLKSENALHESHERQARINQLDEKIIDLQQELLSKDQCVARLKQQIERGKDQKKSLEDQLAEVKQHLEVCEKTKHSIEKDREERNDIIRNLQDKVKKLKSKAEMEGRYKEMYEEIKQEAVNMKEELGSKSSEIKSLISDLSSLQKQITDLELDNHQKDNMISYLNRELTLKVILPSAEALNISPSVPAQKHLSKISSSVDPKFSSPSNLPTASNKTVPKSARLNGPSSVGRKNSSTPFQSRMTGATDSAYGASPSGLTKQDTPDIMVHRNHYTNGEAPQFEDDPDALSEAFETSNPILKHSTAKKSSKPPAKSTPARSLKKRL